MSEVYRIGVAIMLSDGMGPVLSKLSHQLIGIHKTSKDIEGSLNKWRVALVGAGAVMAGSTVLGALAKVAQHGDALLDQQDKMIRQGRTHAEVAKATADYYGRYAKMVPTSSASEFLYSAGTAKIRLGNEATMAQAEKVGAHAAMANALINNALAKSGKPLNDSDKAVDAVIRSAEFAGYAKDPEKSIKFIDELGRSLVAFAGKVDPSTYQKALLIAGIAGKNMSFEAKTRGFLPLVGEMGTRAGNAMDQTYAFMTGRAVISKMQAQWGEKLHLWKGSDLIKNGMVGYQLKPGAVKGVHQFGAENNTDPGGFLRYIIKPAIDDYIHAHPKAGLSTADIATKLMRNQSQMRAAVNYLYDDTYKTLTNELAGIDKSMPLVPQYQKFTKDNPVGVKAAYHNQYESMMQAVGSPLMQAALPIMRGITDVFTKMGALANAHPEAVKIIGEGIAALGVALVGAGAVAIIAALGPAGWIAGGIIALGAAIGGSMNKKTLDELSRDFTTIGKAAAACLAPLKWLANAIMALARFLPGGSSAPKGGSMPSFIPGGEGMPSLPSIKSPGKQGYNAVPSSSAGSKFASAGDIYMDGKKVGAIVTRHQARTAGGPLQGSAYFDDTAAFMPADYAYARG